MKENNQLVPEIFPTKNQSKYIASMQACSTVHLSSGKFMKELFFIEYCEFMRKQDSDKLKARKRMKILIENKNRRKISGENPIK